MQVEMTQISTCTRTATGNGGTQTPYSKKTQAGNGMYTFVYGLGSKRVSETKHCSPEGAKAYKSQLEKAA